MKKSIKTMNLEEFETFAKEFFEVLVDINSDKNEILKLIATWLVADKKIRSEIQFELNRMYELALDAQEEINDDYLMESLEEYNEQIR